VEENQTEKPPWQKDKFPWAKAIGLLVTSSIALAAFGLPFWYTNGYNVPDLTVSGTPTQSSNTWTLPAVVYNEGHAPATNVRVTIDVSGTIQNYTYRSPENITVVKAVLNELIFKMPRLAARASANFTVVSNTSSPSFHIWLTADQGSSTTLYLGTQVSGTSFLQSSQGVLNIVNNLAIALAVISLFATVVLLVSEREKISSWIGFRPRTAR
jgi:hypothetical protein